MKEKGQGQEFLANNELSVIRSLGPVKTGFYVLNH